MPKILHVVSSLKKNGTETFIMNIFRHINHNKFSFDFLTFSDKKEGFYDEIISLGGQIYNIPPRRKGILSYHKNLKNFFSDHSDEYDAVHLHGMSLTTIAPLYYSKKYGIKQRIMHIHGATCEGINNKILHRLNKQRISKIATHWLGCSCSALDWGYKNLACRRKGIIIKNGIDIQKFRYQQNIREQVRSSLNLKPDTLVIGHIGTFNALKNHDFLIDVFQQVHKQKKDSKLICVGEGQLMDSVRMKVNKYNLDDDVLFLGKVDNVHQLLNAFDIFVFPSLSEGLGFVALEAQANGLPGIASTGVPSDVSLSKHFLRIPLTNGKDYWGDQIIKLAEYGRNEIDNESPIFNFSIDNTIRQIEELYSEGEKINANTN